MTRIFTISRIACLEILRRKDIYVLLILLGTLLAVLVSLNIFGLGGMIRYVIDIGLIMAWLFGWILAVNISTKGIPQEEARGTIFPLLAKPITRLEFVIGKWLGAWVVTSTATLLFYMLILTIVTLKGGGVDLAVFAQGYVLHCGALAIVIAIGTLFSTRMNHDAAASMTFVLTAAAFLVVPKAPAFLAKTTGVHSIIMEIIYHLMPHFEILDMRQRMVHFDHGPIGIGYFCTAILYSILMTAVFLILAWTAYRKKHFSRGQIL
jgi:ABC-type transport system involved in multi-copper enzyme maturation permease subunit